MRFLRAFLMWSFACAALVWLLFAVWNLYGAMRPADLDSSPPILPDVVFEVVFLAGSATYAISWWTNWRRKLSERAWGIAASFLTVIASAGLLFLVFGVPTVPSSNLSDKGELSLVVMALIGLGIGFAGLIAFLLRYRRLEPSPKVQGKAAIRGDGTNSFLNRVSAIVFFVAGWEATAFWEHIFSARHIPRMHGGLLNDLPALVVILVVITLLHESGHAAAGVALGMRLRCFVVGPFQWWIREGKWEFNFTLKGILSGGAAGVAPAQADFPNSRRVLMVAAGPVANICTGLVAVWIAIMAGPHSVLQAGGALAFFAEVSIIVAAANLLPFKTGDNYTDGAKIYQLLSGGPWGDFHRAVSRVSSTLVTELRPRDFDIDEIERAGCNINRGSEGLRLRLFSLYYHLDRGEQDEAAQALREASAIYEQSASDISAGLHMEFVFGAAFLLRDAAAARQWWERMEAKKPKRFNVD